MLRLALGTILSLLPRRWRRERPLAEALPWQQGAVLSGLLESLLALAAMVYWYSYSVVHWSANAFDSAMRNGPEAQVPGQAIGFSALVLRRRWLLWTGAMEKSSDGRRRGTICIAWVQRRT